MKVAVIILNWNGKRFLEEYLPGVIRNSNLPGVEVVVADNGSTDDSLAYLESRHPGIRLIRFDRNHGFAEGYNLACRMVESEYFVLLNSDVQVTGDWLVPLLGHMEEDEKVAACQPKIRSVHQPESFEYAGAAGGFIDWLGYPFCRGRILGTLETDQGQYDTVSDIFWATGACMMVRAGAFHAAGGFDPGYFAHMEEIDLCWRLKRMGYRICCIPASTVYHVGGGSLPNESPEKLYLNFRNNLLTLYKNLPPQEFRKVLAVRAMLDIAAAFKYLLFLQFRNTRAVCRSYLDFLRKYRKYRSVRNREHIRFKEIYNRSIVIGYFFSGKRKYSELQIDS